MTRRSPAASLALALTLLPVVASTTGGTATQEPAPAAQTPMFGVGTSAVILDVVVRDRNGRTVRDLQPSDFEVFEDGTRQIVTSVRVFDKGAASLSGAGPTTAAPAPVVSAPPTDATATTAPASSPAPGAAADASPDVPSVIALVFDRMSPEGRTLAHKAARAFMERGYVPGDLVAVFGIDLALATLQPFTPDPREIAYGLALAASEGNTRFASDRAEARERAGSVMAADDQLASLAASAASGGDAAALVARAQRIAEQQQFDRLQSDMLRTFDALERDQQGFATTNGLLAIASALRVVPGRKTVVLFSEGLAVTANVMGQFRSVIAAANRANVSVYAIDTGGLRAESVTAETREEIVQAGEARVRAYSSGREPFGALTRGAERNEDLLRLNPHSGLGQLAEQTGGFLVRDTNDASEGFRRIEEDMRFHYVLTYSPSNERYDGGFRTIAVKVRRPGVEVQSRKGYYAVRPDFHKPVRSFEAPALAELERSPRPEAIQMRTAALSFPESRRPGLAPILVDVPGTAITYEPMPRTANQHADLAVVVRITDDRGRVIDRLSEHYPLVVPAERLEAARSGHILFYREASLAPGKYAVEIVAYDALAKRAGVGTRMLEVSDADGDPLRLSSLVVLGRAERLPPEEQKGNSPLAFGEAMLYPNMGESLRKATSPIAGFFFTVYGGAEPQAPRHATIEVRQGPRSVLKTSTALPAPDAERRIKYAGSIPLDDFAPGTYALLVTVTDGTSSAARSVGFTVGE